MKLTRQIWPLPTVLLVAWGAVARPHDVDEPIADEVGLLYSSQMQFGSDGMPRVTIGVMDGQERVRLSSPDGLALSFHREEDGQWVEKTLRTPPGQRWSFTVASATPGKVTHWCAVASVPFCHKRRRDRIARRWQERGHNVQVFEVGSVFGIRGHVIDNRTYILGIEPFESRQQAEEAAATVFSRHGVHAFSHAHLDRRPSGTIELLDAGGRRVERAVDLVKVRALGSDPVTVHRVEYGRGSDRHGCEDRRYAGTVLITLDRAGRLAVVNRVAVDRVLKGLVPVEIFPDAPMEALKAQAVVARGEVLAKIGTRHFTDPYLLCASTHCQVYAGVQAEKPRASRAVDATRGELLFHGTELVDSVYSASCGGHTENNEVVWSDPPSPALRGKPDMPAGHTTNRLSLRRNLGAWLEDEPPAFCKLSSFNREGIYRWTRTIPADEMNRLVAARKPIGQVVSIQVLQRGVSGRVRVVRVVGTAGELIVQREWPVRRLFGNLRSGMFVVDVETDEEQMPAAFRFRGGGWGHGVGMCQTGATGMAEQGYDYRQILAHYYGGARPVRLYGRSPATLKPGAGEASSP